MASAHNGSYEPPASQPPYALPMAKMVSTPTRTSRPATSTAPQRLGRHDEPATIVARTVRSATSANGYAAPVTAALPAASSPTTRPAAPWPRRRRRGPGPRAVQGDPHADGQPCHALGRQPRGTREAQARGEDEDRGEDEMPGETVGAEAERAVRCAASKRDDRQRPRGEQPAPAHRQHRGRGGRAGHEPVVGAPGRGFEPALSACLRRRDLAARDGDRHGLGARVRAELAGGVTDVHPNGRGRDAKAPGDLLAGEARGEQLDHLVLAR